MHLYEVILFLETYYCNIGSRLKVAYILVHFGRILVGNQINLVLICFDLLANTSYWGYISLQKFLGHV